jgi:transposase
VLALRDERRANLAAYRNRLVNQLHALLRDLVPGGAATELTAAAAARTLAVVRPVGPAEAPRKQLARDLAAEVREVDAQLAKLFEMSHTVAGHDSWLPEVNGHAQQLTPSRNEAIQRRPGAPTRASQAGRPSGAPRYPR